MKRSEQIRLVNLARDNPVKWCETVFGFPILTHQRRIIEAAHGERRSAWAAGHGVGKTRGAANAGLSYLYAWQDSILVTTATTGRQVKDLLWRDIRALWAAAHRRGVRLGGDMAPKAPRIDISEKWFAYGFTADDAESATGQHAERMLVIVDEASGVEQHVWDGIEGMLTSAHAHLLSISNPTRATGVFRSEFKNPNTKSEHISVLDCLDEMEASGIHGLTTRAWVEERRTMPGWGEESTLWRVKVLGLFPEDEQSLLIPVSWYEAAKERAHDVPPGSVPQFGLDVAGEGSNNSVMYELRGNRLECVLHKNGMKPRALTRLALTTQADRSRGGVLGDLRVDGDGIGSEVCDRIEEHMEDENAKRRTDAIANGREEPEPYRVPYQRVRSGMPAVKDPETFANLRAEMGWNLRAMFDPDGPRPISVDPENDLLEGQATSIEWKTDNRGRVLLESKRDMGESPDHFDAASYACANLRKRPPARVIAGGDDEQLWTSAGDLA